MLVTGASRGVGAGSPANSANPNDVVGLYPEFTGTERVEAAFDGPEEIPDGTEPTRYSGRAVAALAADPRVTDRSGDVFKSGELARDYGITDVDGARPEPFTFDATRLRGIRIKSRDGAVPYGLL